MNLERELSVLGVNLPAVQAEKLTGYLAELDRWSRRLNLTALSAGMRIRRLVVEPIWIARELGISGRLVDVGSGNGSPALPICITRPVTAAVLVESRLKRAAFLRHICSMAELPDIEVQRGRFEEAVFAPKPDWITLQAVALSSEVRDALKKSSSRETQIVWITAHGQAPKEDARRIVVPNSTTEAWVFRMFHVEQ